MIRSRLALVAAVAALTLSAIAPAAEAAFNVVNLQCDNSTRSQAQPRVCTYKSTTDTLATIRAANYFTSSSDPKQRLLPKDLLYVSGTDGAALVRVTAATPTTSTVVAFTTGGCIDSSVTFDPAATSFGSSETKNVTATGAALGDSCAVIAPYDRQGVRADCYVNAANSARIVVKAPDTVLRGSATWNPTNVDDGDTVATDITVTGAALGDQVLGCAFSLDVADLTLDCQVTATNTVTATLHNGTGAAVDLASGTVATAVADLSASVVDLASGSWKVRTLATP